MCTHRSMHMTASHRDRVAGSELGECASVCDAPCSYPKCAQCMGVGLVGPMSAVYTPCPVHADSVYTGHAVTSSGHMAACVMKVGHMYVHITDIHPAFIQKTYAPAFRDLVWDQEESGQGRSNCRYPR